MATEQLTELKYKQQIIQIGRRLWQRGMVAANDGNISLRLGDELLITATGVSKGFLELDDIIKLDRDGKVIAGEAKPSSETLMHLEVYRQRADIQAVVHAHPPFAVTFAVSGEALERKILAETVVLSGEVPLVPFGLPSTPEVAAQLRPFLSNGDSFLLEFHGALSLGSNLEAAYQNMERIEFYAQLLWNLKVIDNRREFTPAQIQRLQDLRLQLKKRE